MTDRQSDDDKKTKSELPTKEPPIKDMAFKGMAFLNSGEVLYSWPLYSKK